MLRSVAPPINPTQPNNPVINNIVNNSPTASHKAIINSTNTSPKSSSRKASPVHTKTKPDASWIDPANAQVSPAINPTQPNVITKNDPNDPTQGNIKMKLFANSADDDDDPAITKLNTVLTKASKASQIAQQQLDDLDTAQLGNANITIYPDTKITKVQLLLNSDLSNFSPTGTDVQIRNNYIKYLKKDDNQTLFTQLVNDIGYTNASNIIRDQRSRQFTRISASLEKQRIINSLASIHIIKEKKKILKRPTLARVTTDDTVVPPTLLRSTSDNTNLTPTYNAIGKGIKIRKTYYGKGKCNSEKKGELKTHRYYFKDNKMYLDLIKFKDNIISLKYSKNNGTVPNFRTQKIDNDLVTDLILDILENRFDIRLYQTLPTEDKRIIKNFCRTTGIDINVKDDDDNKFEDKYEILLGEYMAGNDNLEIKEELKKYVTYGISEGLLPQSQGLRLLYRLSI